MRPLFSLYTALVSRFNNRRITNCPAEGYISYPDNRISRTDLLLDFFELREGEGIERCNEECNSHEGCAFFQVSRTGLCAMFEDTFDEGCMSQRPGDFVGVPCRPSESATELSTPQFAETSVGFLAKSHRKATNCLPRRYVPYHDKKIRRTDLILDFFEVGEDGVKKCRNECELRPGCGFFQVTMSGLCVMFEADFNEALLRSSTGDFVGVPCIGSEDSEELSEDHPSVSDCPTEGYITYPDSSVPRSDIILDFFQQKPSLERCNEECNSRQGCGFFQVMPTGFCILFNEKFDNASLLPWSGVFVGVPCARDLF